MHNDSDADSADRQHHHSILAESKHIKGKWKDALHRTRTKFQKREPKEDFKLSQDVDDFLSAGRPPQAPGRPLLSADDRLITPESSPYNSPNHSATDLPRPQASPRGVSIPRLDVSQTTRFPGARPVEQTRLPGNDYLRPSDTSKERSQSLSSFKKRRPRMRNLSVSFDPKPPVVIGVGGEEAEQPTVEISRLRQRTRSLSPAAPGGQHRPDSRDSTSSQGSPASIRRKPVPSQTAPPAYTIPQQIPQQMAQQRAVPPPPPPRKPYLARQPSADPFDDDADFVPKPLARAPTGGSDLMRPSDKEFEMSLQTPDSAEDDSGSHFRTELVSPKPIRPVAPPEVPMDGMMSPPPVTPEHLNTQIVSSQPLKAGAVRVIISNDDGLREPTLPNIAPVAQSTTGTIAPSAQLPLPLPLRQGPAPAVSTVPDQNTNATSGISRMQTMGHRKQPSLNETETMQQGAHGWL